MEYPGPLVEAVLLRRYKRFLADVQWADGRVETVHCPNSGSMTGCWEPGAPCRLLHSSKKTRKLPWTLEQVQVAGTWINIHSARANAVVEEAVRQGRVCAFERPSRVERERPYPGGGRVDLLLHYDDGPRRFVEVKSVTLADGGRGRFPDAVSTRATRHLQRLKEVVEAGDRATLVFLTGRGDVGSVEAAADIDPVYAAALSEVAGAGVQVVAYGCDVGCDSLVLTEPLPVRGVPALR